LFPGDAGNPLHQNSVNYLWRKARTKAEVDYRYHLWPKAEDRTRNAAAKMFAAAVGAAAPERLNRN
jgi:hypothetical protein